MPYYKLVRDKIPEIIKAKGIEPVTHIAKDKEFFNALLDKLREEVEEFIEDSSQEEMADIMEVIYAILKEKGYSFEEIEEVRKKKREERGGFDKKVIAYLE